MDTTGSMANVDPVRLSSDSTFKFKCHPGVKCFTACCRDINIILTPYDIIRLKNRLDLSSEEFLAIYTEPQLLEKTGLPVVMLKFLEEELGLLKSIYSDYTGKEDAILLEKGEYGLIESRVEYSKFLKSNILNSYFPEL